MKQRVISGAIIAVITVVTAYFGGFLLDAVLTFIGLYGSYEAVKVKSERFNILHYVIMAATVMSMFLWDEYSSAFLIIEVILLFAISIFDENEKLEDAAILFMLSFMLGNTLYFMSSFQKENKWMFGYVLIISYLTDVFAFFVGVKFGKHKLNPRVSPKKTIEGSVGGWFFGFLTSFIWAAIFHFFDKDVSFFLISSMCLPLVSEIGDLAFSLIKRHYGVKDFSNLIPGHGGILDRLDSHIFCIIMFGALHILLG